MKPRVSKIQEISDAVASKPLVTFATVAYFILLFFSLAWALPVPKGEWRDPVQSLVLLATLLYALVFCMFALNSYRKKRT